MSKSRVVGKLLRDIPASNEIRSRILSGGSPGAASSTFALTGSDARQSIANGVYELRRRDLVRAKENVLNSLITKEFRVGFPHMTVESLSNEKLQIREKLEKANATILFISSRGSSAGAMKDWNIPFKRRFVDHPNVQVLDLTVNSTLMELLTSKWTLSHVQKQVHEKRFDNYLIYNGRWKPMEKLLSEGREGVVLLLDTMGRVRWCASKLSGLEDLNNFANAVLGVLHEAETNKPVGMEQAFSVCPS